MSFLKKRTTLCIIRSKRCQVTQRLVDHIPLTYIVVTTVCVRTTTSYIATSRKRRYAWEKKRSITPRRERKNKRTKRIWNILRSSESSARTIPFSLIRNTRFKKKESLIPQCNRTVQSVALLLCETRSFVFSRSERRVARKSKSTRS